MLAETLVMNQLKPMGAPVVEALAKRGLPMKAAFWRRFDEGDDWRLMVITNEVHTKGRKYLYTLLAEVLYDLKNHPDHPVDYPAYSVSFFGPNSSDYEDVLRSLGGSMDNLTMSQQVGDAFVYKI
jgi:hypothetical protein